MDSDDGGPFSLTQSLAEGAGGGYTGNSTSVANQYHVWAAAATSTSLSNNNNTAALPTHFSPVSPTGHGLYGDPLTLHPTQSAVDDALSMRLGQGDYHPSTTDRLSQGDGYHTTVGADSGSRHPGNQSDYHDHLVTQERHLGLESYHHISASSSSSSAAQQQDRLTSSEYHTNQSGERLAQNDYHSAQQSSRLSRSDFHSAQPSDRLGQNDYHAAQQSDRLGQSDYHTGQQSDRLAQSDYHVAPQSDRLSQLDYSSGQSERLQGSLTKQDYHALGSDQLGQHASSYHSGQGGQQTSAFHSGQASDRALAAQTDYHSTQVDLDAVSMHTDFDRRHLDVSLLPKDLVDSGQRGSAMDYLTSQSSRDTLAGLHPDIVGLQREMDLSVGQTISLPQRSAPGDLASTSYALDPATLPRDLSPYSPRDLDRAMLSASDVVAGQVADGSGNHASAAGVSLHPQDLAGINLTATSRDLVDMTTLARSGTGRDDLGRVRDVIHRPRGNEIQRALELEVLGSLDSSTASVDLTLNGGSSTKSSSRAYPSASRLASSTKRQAVVASQAASAGDIRLQNPLSAVSANSSANAGINFFPMPTSRDPLNIMAMADPSTAGASSRHSTTDFTRQQPSDMSRLRRELTAPYTDLGVHPSVLASAASLPMPTFKSSVDAVFSAHGDLICNDSLASSRERLYEMMKQQQFCDAVLGTSLHSIKVHKAVLCSASAYLCGVLSQTCMGKSGGRILTVQFKADIPASSLSAFIDYIYQGRIKLVANTVRDLNVMARCLHMEMLKKTSEDMLVSMGASNDADVAIPELILLETLVDKLDKECTASFPAPAPSPPSCHVGVATDVASFPSTLTDQCCQTEDPPVRECDCSSRAVDLRSGGSSLQVGGLGSVSLAVSGGDVTRAEDPKKSAETSHFVSDPVGSSFPMVKPHHKKHLASQASRVKMEAVSVSAAPSLSVSSSLASSVSSTEVTSVTSTTTTTTTSTTETMQKLSVEPAEQNPNIALRSATPNPLPASKLPSKARKKTSMPTSSTHSPFVPSTFTHSVLPGQTARPVLHSYGTRAATRTPTKNLDLGSCPPVGTGCGGVAETQDTKDTSGCGSSEAQIQMAKHRGRTKKGRIAAALSEALKYSSQAGDVANVSDQKYRNVGEDVKTASSNAKMGSDPVQVPSSSASDISPTLTVTQATTVATTSTTALTEAKRSAPRAYRKRLIESVVSDLLLMAKAGIEEQDVGTKYGEGSAGDSEETKLQQLSEAGAPECKGGDKEGAIDTEQLREMLSSPLPPAKRKKKGKTRRMLLSSPSSSGGVRVRAPPKKRAKMELELEKLMREEMEEEEDEEEMAAAAMAAMKMEPRDANSNPQNCSQQPASSSVARIKMPYTKPGKKPRWIKKDQMAHLLIELNLKACSVTEEDCVFICLLCNNRFLLPRRCLSHIMVTHKVPEAEVLDQIEVRRQEEGEKCAADEGGTTSVSDDMVCDTCGYRSKENTTYYLHYHKYFKHGVPLPQGWSVYTCDLCGKELFTKFQLKDHKRTHLEKTPFVCEICGAGFQSRSNLHSHVFHRHSEEKKHSCDKCDRTFKTRTQLSVHVRTHTGVRPFSCPVCPYRSTTRGNMRLHLINRHKLPKTEASDIMRDMKPDFDVSLRSVSQQASSDSGGEKKTPAKKKSSNNTRNSTTKTKGRKKKEAKETQQSSAPKPAQGNQSGLTVSSTIELLLKNSMGDSSSSSSSDKDALVVGKEGGQGLWSSQTCRLCWGRLWCWKEGRAAW